ncbi:MAG: alpha-glucan family phosphorylase [Thermoleophilia bacterium]
MTSRLTRFTVQPRLPERLQPLMRLARNLAWTWDPELVSVLRDINPQAYDRSGGNPIAALSNAPAHRLEELALDPVFVARVEAASHRLDALLAAPRAFEGRRDVPQTIAYFSPEFGVGAALPQYSGGLGVLAGDHLKAASDLGLGIVGVGLFYREGYFRQLLTAAGRQMEEYPDLDPELLPMSPVTNADGTPMRISIAIPPGRTLHAGVWRVDVGRVPLYLMDSDIPENAADLRAVTDRLYGGDREHRLLQEILLGIGGVKLIAELGLEPDVFHSNEGHAGFMGLERIRVLVQERGLDAAAALEAVRAGTVFTTHTPVPAGIDRFHHDLIRRYFGDGGVPVSLSIDTLLSLGAEPNGDGHHFNMAMMGIRLAGRVNGVSRLHGAVSRGMFAEMWPGFEGDDVPVQHVTNGVHAETWVGPEVDQMYRARLGTGYGAHGEGWHTLNDLPDEEVWSVRQRARMRLVEEVRSRVTRIWEGRGMRGAQLGWIGNVLDPNALTIGFARRVPTYKRLTLMIRDTERMTRLLTDPQRPLQLVIAGKAHPADEEGKRLIAELGAFAARPEVRHRIVLLPDYDMALARAFVTGVDVWLNNPLRPFEACGTSGMKASLNGALNLSILDGWWDELYDGMNGFAIPSADDGTLPEDERDDIEGGALLDLLESVVVPRFYERPDGLPRGWLAMVRHTLAVTGPQLLATRMLRDYTEQLYAPAATLGQRLAAKEYAGARELATWKARVIQLWPEVHVEGVEAVHDGQMAGERMPVHASVRLGGLTPDDVVVEAVYGIPEDQGVTNPSALELTPGANVGGATRFSGDLTLPSGPLGLTVRVMPRHPNLVSSADMRLIVNA